MKKLKLVWTNEALNRLTEIYDYISYDSIARARKFINNIIKSTTSIPQYPKKGRIVLEFNISELREIIYKNYRIVYRIKKDQIHVFENQVVLDIEGVTWAEFTDTNSMDPLFTGDVQALIVSRLFSLQI